MRRNKRHRFSSSKQCLQYGTRNGIGPFASNWPRLVQRQAETSDLKVSVDLSKSQDVEKAAPVQQHQDGLKVESESPNPHSASIV